MVSLNREIEYFNTEDENDAIIECMLLEIEILEMKLQSLIMQNQRNLRLIGKGDVLFSRYQIAYMNPEINKTRISVQKHIGLLKII